MEQLSRVLDHFSGRGGSGCGCGSGRIPLDADGILDEFDEIPGRKKFLPALAALARGFLLFIKTRYCPYGFFRSKFCR